jgi:hypothetical protein
MTDTSIYRNASLKHEVHTACHLLARKITPGLSLSISQTIEVLAMEKIKDLGLESELSLYKRPQVRKKVRKKNKKKNGRTSK